jgi:hypothetical protein
MKSKISIILILCVIIFTHKSISQIVKDCNPYYNGHLHKCYPIQQIDFSQEYLKYRINNVVSKNLLDSFTNYHCDSVWLTLNNQQNGIIGKNYQRIQIHIFDISQSNEEYKIYLVKGQSKVNNNICNFSGEIELLKLFCSECDYDETLLCGNLIGKYTFYEDNLQNHSGVFKGIMSCDVFIDNKNHRIKLDESSEVADGYSNRDIFGTWTDYKTGISKKCIWGDYRLPYTFDFDQGDGEMIVNSKYVKYGWQSYNDGSEFIDTGNDRLELKNKWWKH